MKLYSNAFDYYSHTCRFVLAEKKVGSYVKVVDIDLLEPDSNDEVMQHSPRGQVPILVDRVLTLYDARVINDYLDERFPHPQLLPANVVERARNRMFVHDMFYDLYKNFVVLDKLSTSSEKEIKFANMRIREQLIEINAQVGQTKFIISDEMSMADIVLAPLLWRLEKYKITLPRNCSRILKYGEMVFARDSFALSLTEIEKSMRK